MPCDTIRTTPPVRFALIKIPAHIEVLQAALESMGFTVAREGARLSFWLLQPGAGRGTYEAGTLTIPERWQSSKKYGEQAIKVAFAGAAIKFQAKKMGWIMKDVDNEQGELEFEAQRRS